jgi:hypothetical protein
VNGEEKVSKRVDESLATLLKWAARDMDRLMLFTAELTVDIVE